MSLILKSMLRYADGRMLRRDASNIFLQISPAKLRGPYSLASNTKVQGIIIDVDPREGFSPDESFVPLIHSLSGQEVEFIFQQAFSDKDYLFFSTKAQKKLNKVGVIPGQFFLTVEILSVKTSVLNKKVYPKAKVLEVEESLNE